MKNTINMVDFAQQILNAPRTHENAPESLPEVEVMESLASHYKRIGNELKRLKEQHDALKAEMIAEMDARQAEKVVTDTFTISYSLVSSNRLDTARLKKDHPDIYAAYCKESTSTRFTVA